MSSTPVLSVAVIGAGPAGLYLTDALLRHEGREVRVDVFDRLPTPFGLLRYGVAPDHLKMKALAKPLAKVVADPRVRFIGNLEIGRDLDVDLLRSKYSAVVHAYGAALDRTLGIPGEDLPGSTSAASFVRWYSGHPDNTTALPDGRAVEAEHAVVVGAGNVAVDVARILIKSAQELHGTDVPDEVLALLHASPITDVHMLIRRGPAQVKFTAKELRELGEIDGVDVLVPSEALELAEADLDAIAEDRMLGRSVDVLREWALREPTGAQRRLHVHFWTSPIAIEGSEAVTGVVVSARSDDGARETTIPAELVVRCVGYRGLALPGVPFDEESGTIPNDHGRVLRDGVPCVGEYAAGWISRGPTGVIGSNKSDAGRVVELMLGDDLPDVEVWDVVAHLHEAGLATVDHDGWLEIDRAEITAGESRGGVRAKLATWDELLAASRG
ncbi:FAD-dependent oxidoreductase [Nocardioides acrostichi]|uniref:ferredoxin--NADP(+) reductase n=1 Tax=Nocardioides acrostichi TaxID=2784339 RepID=A0A930V0K1_9ACTN|nr:FAD-dependent oxidoreductase [Nocardioides acrostichi]MBF4161505.1 FAD-dependent oxidoreductase [Nocardioides acrostichi]